MTSTAGPTVIYRNLFRLSERKKRHRNEVLTSQMNSDEQDNSQIFDDGRRRNVVHRGMDRIRKSLRESFRKRVSRGQQSGAGSSNTQGLNGHAGCSGSGKLDIWLPDETTVRNGTCSFTVKYLGGIEVFESRGMQICEGALKILRAQRRRPIKAILYISGDGLRVVDQESSRGLVVDQTIEKVSFCAPDRNHDKGFAYICRDGTSRRWMCHGFQAIKESGERLSHAVGCAFAICLERKKKRDAEAAAAVQAAAGFPPRGCEKTNSTGFTLHGFDTQPLSSKPEMSTADSSSSAIRGSFRRLSITERLQDPQTAIVQTPPPSTVSMASELQITPKPRPLANPLLFERQGSLRAPASSMASASALRRQQSLRSNSDSPAKKGTDFGVPSVRNEPILEDDEEKNWLNGGIHNLGSTIESAPYCSTHYNGFRQSFSYTAPPSLFTESLSVQQPYNGIHSSPRYQMSAANEDMVLNNVQKTDAVNMKLKADEWLEQTLRSSLGHQADKVNGFGTASSSRRSDLSPSHLSAQYANSVDNYTNAPLRTIKFNSDYSLYSLPPITENVNAQTEKAAPVNSQEVDLFGLPKFNPLPAASNNPSTASNSSNANESRREIWDPFDVRWSQLAVKNAAVGYQQTASIRSTNPFSSESNALKIS